MSDLPELELVGRMRAGDARAFDAFYKDYFPRVYRFVLARSGGDDRWAEEVTQAALVQAMRGLAGFRGDASLFSWLCRIALRELMRARGRGALRATRETRLDALDDGAEQPLDAAPEPAQEHARARTSALVHEVLDALPPRFGDALEMKYVEGLSVQEIAARWDIGTTAVQSLLARARASFRAAYERRFGPRGGPGDEVDGG